MHVRDCNAYTDLHESGRRLVTPEMWAARKVERRVYNDGSIIVHELTICRSALWNTEAARRLLNAERATSLIEKDIAVKPTFVRQWQTERNLLRDLARDVEMGRLGHATVVEIEEREEKRVGQESTTDD